jgi:two-component system LytT family response regulator
MSQKNLQVLLIGSDHLSLSHISDKFNKLSGVKIIGEVNDPDNSFSVIEKTRPDAIVLDVGPSTYGWLNFLKKVRRGKVQTEFIFVSENEKYTIPAIKNSVFDYLLKPLNERELTNTINRLLKKTEKRVRSYNNSNAESKIFLNHFDNLDKILFSTGSGFIMVKPEEIFYILADWNYSEIFFNLEKHELVTNNLGSVEKDLPKGKFYRVNRSIIINLRYLWKVNRKKHQLILQKDGEEFSCRVPILNLRRMEYYLKLDNLEE